MEMTCFRWALNPYCMQERGNHWHGLSYNINFSLHGCMSRDWPSKLMITRSAKTLYLRVSIRGKTTATKRRPVSAWITDTNDIFPVKHPSSSSIDTKDRFYSLNVLSCMHARDVILPGQYRAPKRAATKVIASMFPKTAQPISLPKRIYRHALDNRCSHAIAPCKHLWFPLGLPVRL